MDATKEKLVGCALAGGLALTVVGLFLTWLFSVSGVYRGTYTRDVLHGDRITDAGTLNLVPLALLLTVFGIVILSVGIFYGLWYNKNHARGPRKVIEHARVLSRYGYNREGHMLTQSWEFAEADDPRFYVRMQTGQGQSAEYECVEQVFFQCGEGMWGEAEVQGKWLGKFTPYIGTPQSS